MKLELGREGNIEILKVTGPISTENLQVLRAGVTKLLRAGRNRIVLQMLGPQTWEAEVMRELAALNLLARELAGDVVLAGLDAQARAKVKGFAKPPAIPFFEDVAAAVDSLRPKSKQASEADLVAPANVAVPSLVATATPMASPAAAGSGSAETEVARLKTLLHEKETQGIGTLRKEVERLKAENARLAETVQALFVEKRAAPDLLTSREKITMLESQVADLLEKMAQA